MPVEIEAKMKLDDDHRMADLLLQHGAVSLGQFLETDAFYDTPDRSLLASDQGLRIRVSRNLATGQSHCTLTHKGPNQPGQLKTRDETELLVDNPDAAATLLQRLGFVRCLSFQKRRHSWRLDDCRIELDQLPLLGSFIEIEGPAEGSILRIRDALGLADRPLISTPYIAILSNYMKIQDRSPATEFRFPEPSPAP